MFNKFRLNNTATRGDMIRAQAQEAGGMQFTAGSQYNPNGQTGPTMAEVREKMYGRGGGALDVAGIEAGKYRKSGKIGESPFAPQQKSVLRTPAPTPVNSVGPMRGGYRKTPDLDVSYTRDYTPDVFGGLKTPRDYSRKAFASTSMPTKATQVYQNPLRNARISSMHQTSQQFNQPDDFSGVRSDNEKYSGRGGLVGNPYNTVETPNIQYKNLIPQGYLDRNAHGVADQYQNAALTQYKKTHGFADGGNVDTPDTRRLPPGRIMEPGKSMTGVADDVGPVMVSNDETLVPKSVGDKFDAITGEEDFLGKTTLANHSNVQDPAAFDARIKQAGGEKEVERFKFDNPNNPLFGEADMKKNTKKMSPLRGYADGDVMLPYSKEKKIPYLFQSEGEAAPSLMGAFAQSGRESAAKDRALNAAPAPEVAPEQPGILSRAYDAIMAPIKPSGKVLNTSEQLQLDELDKAADGTKMRSPLRGKKQRAVAKPVKGFADGTYRGRTYEDRNDAALNNSIIAATQLPGAYAGLGVLRDQGMGSLQRQSKVVPLPPEPKYISAKRTAQKVFQKGGGLVSKTATRGVPLLGAGLSGHDAVKDDVTGEYRIPTEAKDWRDIMRGVGALGMGAGAGAAMTGIGVPVGAALAGGGALISAAPDIYDFAMSQINGDESATPYGDKTPKAPVEPAAPVDPRQTENDRVRQVEDEIRKTAPDYSTTGMPEGIASYGRKNGVPSFGNNLATNPTKPYDAYQEAINARAGGMRNNIATANAIADHAFYKWQDSGRPEDEAAYRAAQSGLANTTSAYQDQRVADEAPPMDPIMASIRAQMGYDEPNALDGDGVAAAVAGRNAGGGSNGSGRGGRGMNYLDIVKMTQEQDNKDRERQDTQLNTAAEQLRKAGVPEDMIISSLDRARQPGADWAKIVNEASIASMLQQKFPAREGQTGVDYYNPKVWEQMLAADELRKGGTKNHITGWTTNPELDLFDQIFSGTTNVTDSKGRPYAATTQDLTNEEVQRIRRGIH